MKTLFFTFLTLTILLIATVHGQAQPPPFPFATPDQAPIDGGLGLLAAAGGVYAWRKLRKRRE